MKLLEFLGNIREDDSSDAGTFVGARLTRDSEKKLMQWMRDNYLRKREPRARLHITVIGDQEKSFDWNPATFDPPLEIDTNSYKITRLGDDGEALVLSFSVPELEKRHEDGIKKYGINWKHPTYQPHITLSFDKKKLNDDRRLLTPTFPMYVKKEYVQSWKHDPKNESTDRRRDSRTGASWKA